MTETFAPVTRPPFIDMHIIKHNEHERVKELIITSGVLAALATAFTVARIVAKRMRQLTWAWDDTLIATGLVSWLNIVKPLLTLVSSVFTCV